MNERMEFIRAAGTQVVAAYEQLGLSPVQIAEQMEMEEAQVKSLLYQLSTKYKQELGGIIDSTDELVKLYEDLARCSPNDLVREKALRFLIDERKGRNDIPMELLRLKRRQQANEDVDILMKVSDFNKAITSIRESVNNTLLEAKAT